MYSLTIDLKTLNLDEFVEVLIKLYDVRKAVEIIKVLDREGEFNELLRVLREITCTAQSGNSDWKRYNE